MSEQVPASSQPEDVYFLPSNAKEDPQLPKNANRDVLARLTNTVILLKDAFAVTPLPQKSEKNEKAEKIDARLLAMQEERQKRLSELFSLLDKHAKEHVKWFEECAALLFEKSRMR